MVFKGIGSPSKLVYGFTYCSNSDCSRECALEMHSYYITCPSHFPIYILSCAAPEILSF